MLARISMSRRLSNFLCDSLESCDPEIYDLIELEKKRQFYSLELIASENFTSRACLEALGSVLTNKYSEGLPGMRYYGGNEVIDEIENLCKKRCLEAFELDPSKWGVNVQSYSGSTANFSVYTALLKPFDRLMGLDLPHGGHLSHGFQTSKKKISSSSIYFTSMPYQTDPKTGLIDYNKLEESADLFRPNLIICGASAYPRDWDFQRFRKIADRHEAYLVMDMAHTSGLIAAKQANNPFDYCDVITSTTHKTLRGPRAGIIFYRKPVSETEKFLSDLESRINFAVFPSCQASPHNHQIASIAVAMKQVSLPEFKDYIVQVKKNAVALANSLISLGYRLVTGGTDNHCILWDLRPLGLTGSKLEKLCEKVSISLNKNSVPKDTSALSPGGVRIGTPALTSRGFKETDFVEVAEFLHRAVHLCLEIQVETGKALPCFLKALENNPKLNALKTAVEAFASKFEMPGFDISDTNNKI
ncbi:uncharacterized protein LOC135121060 [Zophobas morio]|uniref:uncharacterized protein LOC135121060 n=1 Tax=Zophobas morio TaxID=2755281 RepID=UPI003083D5FC